MVRVGGLSYACEPGARMGARVSDLRLGKRLLEADKVYRVAGWAAAGEGASGRPVWEAVARYLRDLRVVRPKAPGRPRLIGVERDPGGDLR